MYIIYIIFDEDLQPRSSVKAVTETKYARKKGWAGHATSMNDNRWKKQTDVCYPGNVKQTMRKLSMKRRGPLIRQHAVTWTRAQDRK